MESGQPGDQSHNSSSASNAPVATPPESGYYAEGNEAPVDYRASAIEELRTLIETKTATIRDWNIDRHGEVRILEPVWHVC